MSEENSNRAFHLEDTIYISETAKVRSKTELYLREAAETAAGNACKHRQDKDWKGELKAAASAVILAQAAIEGYFHALLDTFLRARGRKEDFDHLMGHHRLEERVTKGLELLTGEAVEKGRQPWQDFHLLRMIRNALVHYQPAWETLEDEPVEILKVIRATERFRLREERSRWDEKVLTADCATWALSTAEDMIRLFREVGKRLSEASR